MRSVAAPRESAAIIFRLSQPRSYKARRQKMKTLYLDIFSGISGDMLVGALIDLGADARKLERELKKLKLGGYHLHVARKQKSGIEGVKFDVHLADPHEHHRGHHPDHSHDHHQAHDTPHHPGNR